jgi:hypothetical protein
MVVIRSENLKVNKIKKQQTHATSQWNKKVTSYVTFNDLSGHTSFNEIVSS